MHTKNDLKHSFISKSKISTMSFLPQKRKRSDLDMFNYISTEINSSRIHFTQACGKSSYPASVDDTNTSFTKKPRLDNFVYKQ